MNLNDKKLLNKNIKINSHINYNIIYSLTYNKSKHHYTINHYLYFKTNKQYYYIQIL